MVNEDQGRVLGQDWKPLDKGYDKEWYRRWREYVGDDLCGGYATLSYPNEDRMQRLHAEWAIDVVRQTG